MLLTNKKNYDYVIATAKMANNTENRSMLKEMGLVKAIRIPLSCEAPPADKTHTQKKITTKPCYNIYIYSIGGEKNQFYFVPFN